MRVICSKCQFENQADPNTSRVVCARCATIIDVAAGLEENFGGGYGSNKLPASGGGNFGNASGNFGANYSSGYEQTVRPGAYPPAPVSRPQLPEGDVYATRIDDDFDDVLDIPRPNTQLQNYQYNDHTPAFDDVFSTPGNYETMIDSRPADPYQANPYQQPNAYQANNAYQTEAYQPGNAAFQGNAYDQNPTFDQPNYGAPQQDAEFMGWPVLPEDTTDPGIPPTSAFSRKSGLLKAAAALVVIGALALAGYSWIFGGKKPTNPKVPAVVVEDGGTDVANNATGEGIKPAGSAPVGPSGPSATAPATRPVVIPPVTIAPAAGTARTTATVLPPKSITVNPPAPVAPKPTPVAAAPKAVPVAPTAPATPNKGNITIQAGSFNDQAQANERVKNLKAANVDARVTAANIPGKGTWYRVQIGRFPSRDQAASYANQLRGRGAVQDFIVTPVN